MRSTVLLILLGTAQVAFARPPGFRDGANHHVGDDSFVAAFGRPPTTADREALRMHTHLLYAHDLLAARPATRPELATRRAEILGYLAEYVAHGVTPRNAHVPWRSPVFIDEQGTICAVGYLIERSAGRPLAERIAAGHRTDYIEDIAKAMPEVRDWIARSGLSLQEIASIQPGYESAISAFRPWDAKASGEDKLPEGAVISEETGLHGTISHGKMEGTWTHVVDGKVLGSGNFVHGAGRWKSVYPDGATEAEGPYAGNLPHGAWRFYHPSGALAAEGSFVHGWRSGEWRFYQDSPARTLISTGAFAKGEYAGTWRHFDVAGKLIATASTSVPARWRHWGPAFLLDVLPGATGVRHQVHQGSATGDYYRLDALLGPEKLYIWNHAKGVLDAAGNLLVRTPEGWRAHACAWTPSLKAAARAGDLPNLHARLRANGIDLECSDAGTMIPVARARRIDAELAAVTAVRSPTPSFLHGAGRSGGAEYDAGEGDAPSIFDEVARDPDNQDFTKLLAATMTWYIEWPQVDGKFVEVFHGIPGYTPMTAVPAGKA